MAIELGASAIGLVSEMPSGPGVISEDSIREIAARVPPGIATFLLTCKQTAADIIDQQNRLRPNAIQICDRLENGTHQLLRSALPGVSLVQVIHVRGPESIEEARSVAPYVDAILLDSGDQSKAVKELGGTGRIHDWEISKQIREQLDIPIFLAGGLNSQNVAGAISHVGPFAVDVCSGVRTNGRLDATKLQNFFEAIAPVHHD